MVLSDEITTAPTGEDALETAVQTHARLVFRIAYSVLRNHHDAEDATQETFIRVLRYGSKLAKVEDQKGWLARIAWRVAVERRKKARHGSGLAADEVEQLRSPTLGAEEALLGSEKMRLLERVIARLPGKLRDPLILSTLEEMSPADIAGVLETSETAVRSRIFRARKILKEKLALRLETNYGK